MYPLSLLISIYCLLLQTHAHYPGGSNLPDRHATPAPKAPFPIYNFSSTVTPENLILRRNGKLLVSDLTGPLLYQLDPTQGPGQTVKVVHEFEGYSSTTGLVELEPDVFALGVGNFTLADGPTRGTWKIWRIDLRQYVAPGYIVHVSPLVSAPPATILGGITMVNASAGLLAATDYVQGTLWLMDIPNNRTTPITTSRELATTTVGSGGDIGVNGLKYRDGRLYFQVTTTGLYGSLPINTLNGTATGAIEEIFTYAFELDDFTFADSGNVYMTTLNSMPNGGIYRRHAGTPVRRNRTVQVVSAFGTNAVVVRETGCGCEVLFCAALTHGVFRSVLGGRC